MFRTFQVPKLADVQPKHFVRRNQIHPSLLASEADTLGWDTVSAIRLPDVNRTLEKSNLYPKTFKEEMDKEYKWDAHGSFGSWKIIRGGSGAILYMKVPITQAIMNFGKETPLEIKDASVSISIKLEYLPQPPSSDEPLFSTKAGNGTPQYLTRNAEGGGEDDPAVIINTIDYGKNPVGKTEVMKSFFHSTLSRWFNENLDQFSYVFSVVNINAMAAEGAFQWLQPTYTSYAYHNGINDEQSYFGVLNMCQNNSAEGLDNQLPPGAIPSDDNASLLISSKNFLLNMVLPGLPKAFPDASEENFMVTGNDTIIEKTGDDIKMEKVKVNGSSYTPYLQRFTYQIMGDEIQMNMKVKVNISPGIDAYIIGTYYYKIILVDKPDGTQTLDFEESRPAEEDHWSDIATWVTVTTAIATLILSIVSAVAGKVIKETMKRIIAVIVINLVAGLVAAIPSIIAKVVSGGAADALPPVGPLVADATGNIEWPEASDFHLGSVQLNGSLMMGGKYNYES